MRPKAITEGQLETAWALKRQGKSMREIAEDLGVFESTLYRNMARYVESGRSGRPTREETIEKVRAFAGPALERMTQAERMRTIFVLRGAVPDSVLCEAVGVSQAAFGMYLRNADERGVTKRIREDYEILAAIRSIRERPFCGNADAKLLVALLREDYGITTSERRVVRLLDFV